MKNKYILIDDDDLIHQVWKLSAEDRKIDLKTFKSVKEFLNAQEDINSIICLDSNLKNEIGELEAENIYKKGFKKIYLVTAKHSTEIETHKYILEVKGKKPIWATL